MDETSNTANQLGWGCLFLTYARPIVTSDSENAMQYFPQCTSELSPLFLPAPITRTIEIGQTQLSMFESLGLVARFSERYTGHTVRIGKGDFLGPLHSPQLPTMGRLFV